MLKRTRLAGAAAAMLALPAFAAQWAVDPAHSTLTFEGSQKGESFSGSFPNFTCEIDFDETTPEQGRIHVSVPMSSVTADSKERQEALPTADWFAAAKFPTAEFISTSIRKTGPHQYAAQGTLAIRGVTHDATLPFALTPEGTQTRAEGSFTLNRKDYGIGGGQWASDAWIAYPVTVRYRLLASPR